MEHAVFLPQRPGEDQDETILRLVEQFDLVIIQRCFKYDIFQMVRRACSVAGKPLLFESDDDYLGLDATNPCSVEMESEEAKEGFRMILREADAVTVTTQELKDVYYLYNKNIKILPNNVESVSLFKDEYIQQIGLDGQIPMHEIFGFVSYPTTISIDLPGKGTHLEKLIRIGYTATPTHRHDFLQIQPALEKYFKRNPNSIMFYLGDEWFKHAHPSIHKNVVFIPNMQYDLYMQNIRNFDIGIAPLAYSRFNMSKSPLKLLEYASWGIPAVAPRYITYTREFTHEKDVLFYQNNNEMVEQLERLTKDHELRTRLGLAAAEHVKKYRTEAVNGKERYDFYRSVVDSHKKFQSFAPKKKVVSV